MDEEQLIQAYAKNHDAAAFEQLVDRHGPMVLGICRRLLGNSADADDAFQATFLLLAMRAGRIREPRLIGNWLFGVATRTALGARRSAARRIVREKRLMRFLRSKHRSETDDADLRMTLDEQIHRLPEKLRRVVVCHHLQGLTTRETAEQLRWPESTVMARLKQARALLKERLSRKGLSITDATIGATIATVAVPAILRAATIKAGTAVAVGNAGAGGIVSAKAAAMAKGTAKSMFVVKMKLAAAVVAATIITVAGAAAMKSPAVAAPAPPAPTAAAGLKLPPAIEKALRANEDQLDPINISWTDTMTSELSAAELEAEVKPNSDTFIPRENRVVWRQGKIYNSIAIGTQRFIEVSFDGRISYVGNSFNGKRNSNSKELNSDNVKTQKHIPGVRGTMVGDGYLTNVGLRAISSPNEFAAGRADSEVIAMLADGATLASVDDVMREGVALVRLKIVAPDPQRAYADRTNAEEIRNSTNGMSPEMVKKNYPIMMARWEASKKLPEKRDYFFDLDPAKNYAVVEREERSGGRILSTTQNSDFRQLPDRTVWLPGKSITLYYTGRGDVTVSSSTPLLRQETTLKEITFTPSPPERFVVEYPERSVMHFDRTKEWTGTHEKYRPPTTASAEMRSAPIFQPLADVPAAAEPVERHSVSGWLIGIALLVFAAVGVWLQRRRATLKAKR